MIDIRNKKMVITRKAHTCFACIEEIEKGKSSVYVNAKEDEQRIQFHLHEECNKTIVKDQWFTGSGLYHGCIKNAKDRLEGSSVIKFSSDEELPFFMKFNIEVEV
ncbi:hypothetical protein [Lysinibacillus xylanilyticus]|uniref:hypothetical protein n=1 Tax=Lysinibacillus xylanilyticus TaxID=582475 RepID=UPI0036D88940